MDDKKYNIQALFSRGYRLTQKGLISWELTKDDNLIVEVDTESASCTLDCIYEQLERELHWTIDCIESNDEDYFYGKDEAIQVYQKTVLLKKLKDIYDWLV